MSHFSPGRSSIAAALVAALGLSLVATPASAETIKLEKTVNFLGFSENQRQAAWSMHIQRFGRSGSRTYIDRYALIRVVRSVDNSPFSTYRVGEIKRTTLRGRKIPTKPAELDKQHPMWFQASPKKHWDVMVRGFQFSAARLTASTAVAAVPDPDVDLITKPRNSGVVEFRSKSNHLGYTLSMTNGDKATLGRFRHDVSVRQRPKALLEVYISVAGDYAAILNRFETIGAKESEPGAITYGKIAPITATGAAGGEFIWVRMSWGWKKMTPYQERIYRESRAQRLKFAQTMLGLANGVY